MTEQATDKARLNQIMTDMLHRDMHAPRPVTEADLRRAVSATMLRACPKCGAHITNVNRGDLAYQCGAAVQRDEHGPRWVQECVR